jgi:hypothetical protein
VTGYGDWDTESREPAHVLALTALCIWRFAMSELRIRLSSVSKDKVSRRGKIPDPAADLGWISTNIKTTRGGEAD